MADPAQVIQALGGINGESIDSEALAAAATVIKPGHLIEELAAGTLQEHSGAGLNAQKLVALTDLPTGGTIDDVYTVAASVRYGAFHAGQEAFLRLAASAAAIVISDKLVSNGDGTVRKATIIDVKAALTIAGEADANGDLTFTSILDGEHGNDIQVILADAGTAAVVVDGLVITITPASAGNTATEVIAQVVADPGASSLIIASTGGSGATEPGNATIANLTGGVDGETDSDETIAAYALEAVDNSGGGSEVFIKVRFA